MRTIGIQDRGFLRLATEFELEDQPEAGQEGALDPQQIEQDLEALHQWINYFQEAKTMTDQEIQSLRDQVEFLESHVYDNTGIQEGSTPEMENRLNLLEQQTYEGPGTQEASPDLYPPARKQSPKKKKKVDPYAAPKDRVSQGWWDDIFG